VLHCAAARDPDATLQAVVVVVRSLPDLDSE